MFMLVIGVSRVIALFRVIAIARVTKGISGIRIVSVIEGREGDII